ncbi:hypothetical protein AB3N59_16045 [Leptospira sp. WS92.C1]
MRNDPARRVDLNFAKSRRLLRLLFGDLAFVHRSIEFPGGLDWAGAGEFSATLSMDRVAAKTTIDFSLSENSFLPIKKRTTQCGTSYKV